jgi:hypothetical protein
MLKNLIQKFGLTQVLGLTVNVVTEGIERDGALVRERQRCTARVDVWRMGRSLQSATSLSRVGRALRCVCHASAAWAHGRR